MSRLTTQRGRAQAFRAIETMDDVRRFNADCGFYFFTPDTMRWFGSRIVGGLCKGPGGLWFVTSERQPAFGCVSAGERLYTVRRVRPDGRIDDDSAGFQGYASARVASRRAERYAAGRCTHVDGRGRWDCHIRTSVGSEMCTTHAGETDRDAD